MQDQASLVAVLNSTWFASGLEPAVQTRLAALSRMVTAEAGQELATGTLARDAGYLACGIYVLLFDDGALGLDGLLRRRRSGGDAAHG